MNNVSIQKIRGHSVPFFASPAKKPDLPWVATYELARAFVTDDQAHWFVEAWKTFPTSGRLEARAYDDAIVTIMPHTAAQGLVSSIDETFFGVIAGQEEKGPCFKAYAKAGVEAVRELTRGWSEQTLFEALKNGTHGTEHLAEFPRGGL